MKYFKKGKYTEKDIDKEYRRLSLIYHPDRPNGDTQKFQELLSEYQEIKQQFAERAKQKGDNVNYNRIKREIRNIDDIFDILNVPDELLPIAKEIAKRFGEKFTQTIEDFLTNKKTQ